MDTSQQPSCVLVSSPTFLRAWTSPLGTAFDYPYSPTRSLHRLCPSPDAAPPISDFCAVPQLPGHLACCRVASFATVYICSVRAGPLLKMSVYGRSSFPVLCAGRLTLNSLSISYRSRCWCWYVQFRRTNSPGMPKSRERSRLHDP